MTIKNDVESSVAYAAEKTHNAIDETEEKIDESIDATDARFASIETLLRDNAERDNAERFLASAKEMSRLAEKHLRIHPLATLGVAVIVGIAAARIMRR